MPRNFKGGNKAKKAKNCRDNIVNVRRPLMTLGDDQVYACVLKKIGGTRLEVECSDNKIRNAVIPGKIKKKIWMNIGDVLICDIKTMGKRDENKMEECYIVHKYNTDEISTLKAQGKIMFGIIDDDEDNNIMMDRPVTIDTQVNTLQEFDVLDYSYEYSDI